MYQLELSDEARLDIIEVFLWYETQRTGLGLDFELCLEAGLNQVKRNPLIFEMRYKNMRVHFIERFQYGIHFLIDKQTVRVLGVFHTSRNPNSWYNRIK